MNVCMYVCISMYKMYYIYIYTYYSERKCNYYVEQFIHENRFTLFKVWSDITIT